MEVGSDSVMIASSGGDLEGIWTLSDDAPYSESEVSDDDVEDGERSGKLWDMITAGFDLSDGSLRWWCGGVSSIEFGSYSVG